MPKGLAFYKLYAAGCPNERRRKLHLSFILVAEHSSPMARMADPRMEARITYADNAWRCAWAPYGGARERRIAGRLYLGHIDAEQCGALRDFIEAPQHLEHVSEKMAEAHTRVWDDEEWVACVLLRLQRTTLLQWAVTRPDVARVPGCLEKFVGALLEGGSEATQQFHGGPPICSCPSLKRA